MAMIGGRGMQITTVVVLFISVHYYVPVPEEFATPWSIRIPMGLLDILNDLGILRGYLTGQEPMSLREEVLEFLVPHVDQSSNAPVKLEDRVIAGVPTRIYTPKEVEKNGPLVIYFHGGGWTYGSLHIYEPAVYELAKETGMKVISVDYRLAFTAVFPASFDDCLTVTTYVLKNGKEFDIDPKRVAVLGDSAGGNLATTVALALKKAQNKPKLQVLIYPVVQAIDFKTPSYQQNGESRLSLTTEHMYMYFQYYAVGYANFSASLAQHRHIDPAMKKRLQEKYMPLDGLPGNFLPTNYKHPVEPEDTDKFAVEALAPLLTDERCSPLFADDLSGLPDTYIYTAFYDVLRDESVWYANRLKEAGVKVENFIHKPSFHTMFCMFDRFPEGRVTMDSIVKYVKDNI